MKKSVMTMLLAFLTMGAVAQATDGTTGASLQSKSDTTTVSAGKTNPAFPGGEKALRKYIGKKLRYPELAAQYGVEGSVVINFVVDKDGRVKNITAKDCKLDRFNTTKFSQETKSKQESLRKQFALLFAQEGARVVRKMPKWTPASLNGVAVATEVHLPIRFIDPNK